MDNVFRILVFYWLQMPIWQQLDLRYCSNWRKLLKSSWISTSFWLVMSTKIPRDAQVIQAILKDMGITEYEPRVINQLLEFIYRKSGILLFS